MTKSTKKFISTPLREVRTGTQSTSRQVSIEAEIMKKNCLLLCPLWCVQPDFYTMYDPRVEASTVSWAIPHQSLIKPCLPTDQSDGGIFSTETPSSQINSTTCQVNKKTTNTPSLPHISQLCLIWIFSAAYNLQYMVQPMNFNLLFWL